MKMPAARQALASVTAHSDVYESILKKDTPELQIDKLVVSDMMFGHKN